jgi:beta-lactamase superfamily II metal-dependent hydrolase
MGLQVSVFNGYDDNVVSNSTDICNDGGLIFRVSSAHTSMLFCADVSTAMEDTILSEYRDRLASDYVQMGHHGNSTFSFDFYDAVGAVGAFYDAPDWLVTGESYTTQKYIRYMQEKGADVYLWYTAPNEVKLN